MRAAFEQIDADGLVRNARTLQFWEEAVREVDEDEEDGGSEFNGLISGEDDAEGGAGSSTGAERG